MARAISPWAQIDRPDAQGVRSADGVLRFELQVVDTGLYIRRELWRPGGGRVTQASIFPSCNEFRNWCNAATLRFRYPLVHAELIRVADRLFDEHESAFAAG